MTTPEGDETRITREVRGALLLMGFHRPRKKNAFDLPMLHELAEAFTQLDQDPALRCGVVFAHGGDFTAGLDLANVAPALVGGQRGLAPEGMVDPWGTHGRPCSKPVVVAVEGLCLTLGLELILATELCVAADNARFGQIEIKRGIFPFGGGNARWVTRVGWGNAMRWLLTGDMFDAAEALRIGLVQELVPAGQALARALSLATVIAEQAPLGVQATLRSARLAVREGEEASAQALLPELARLMASDDAQEGMRSFLERRQAQFTGK